MENNRLNGLCMLIMYTEKISNKTPNLYSKSNIDSFTKTKFKILILILILLYKHKIIMLVFSVFFSAYRFVCRPLDFDR